MPAIAVAIALVALKWAGAVKRSTRQKGEEVLLWLAASGIRLYYVWGYDPNVSNTEHHSGYALDFMVPGNKALGDKIYNYLWANRTRLGVLHIIWWQTITSTRVQPGVRRLMKDRGNDTENHKDHVHVQFLPTAYLAPRRPTPAPKPSGGTGKANPTRVKAMQTALEVTSDGAWGKGTEEWAMRMRTAARAEFGYPRKVPKPYKVAAVQAVVDVKQDGDRGPKTLAALQTWIKEFQKAMGLTGADVDGIWGEKTDDRFMKIRSENLNNF